MASLAESLAAAIPQEALHLGCVLREAMDRGDHIELLFDAGGEMVTVAARRVVLAVPPRLLAEQVRFTPALPSADRAAMSATPTWMAAQAKAVVGSSGPPAWREAGHSGNAFVVHDQAVLGEIFDACDAAAGRRRLADSSLSRQRCVKTSATVCPCSWQANSSSYSARRSESGEPRMQDWAKEKFTCAQADLDLSDAASRLWLARAAPVALGRQALSRRVGNRARGRRLCRRSDQRRLSHPRPDVQAAERIPIMTAPPDLDNQRCLERFGEWVASRQGLRQLSPKAQLRALPWTAGAVNSARDAWRHGGGVHRRAGRSRRTAIQP